jgi:Rieske Fe-S protein
MERREFVGMTVRGVLAAGAVGCGMCGAAGAQQAGGGKQPRKPRGAQVWKAGAVGTFDRDGHFDVLLKPGEIWVMREGKKLVAFSAVCTHKGCIVRPQKDQGVGDLECPCHGSVFGADGALVDGQAKSSLEHYGISIDQGEVLVDTSRVFEEKRWGEEGAFVMLP